jgi:hypothetical protein
LSRRLFKLWRASVGALIKETVYVALVLRKWPREKFFRDTLKKLTVEEVVSQYSNCSKFLSKDSCRGWIENTPHAMNRRYFFLFIDENGVLK